MIFIFVIFFLKDLEKMWVKVSVNMNGFIYGDLLWWDWLVVLGSWMWYWYWKYLGFGIFVI